VGTIIKVSRLYETPAWGFESDAFLCAGFLIGSKVLSQVLKIEKRLGRCEIKYKNTSRVPLILI
jgi:7,8-dihydro-6-hydroxymethylpterin-pyrophosphokinase